MNIGIIGSGVVAQSLGKGLVANGHTVMLGTRDPNKEELKAWCKNTGKHGLVGNTTEVANYGELVILAVAWHAAEDILQKVRPELVGKVVIDVTNPLVFHEDQAPELSVGHDMSGGEVVQKSLPDSHVVKTLNIINHANMAQPKYKQGTPIMFLAGNNESAKKHVNDLLQELGWQDVVDLGGIEKSRLLEPLCLLWVEYGLSHNTWDHAFAVLKK